MKYTSKVIWMLCLVTVLCLSLATCTPAQKQSNSTVHIEAAQQPLTAKQVQQVVEQNAGLVLLDVRTPEEYNQGHLEGAINIDFKAADFEKQVSSLDPSKTYLLYCKSGNRSGQANTIMLKKGFKNLFNSGAGFEALKEAGLPVEDQSPKFR